MQLLELNKLNIIGGAHDALSAKIVALSGYDGIWASGLGISAVHCVPDMSILSMNEFVSTASYMTFATDKPVIFDCDAGFGNLHNVFRMVKEFERAGVSAICMEDKKHPKLNSFIEKEQICEDADVFASKIRVAVDSRKSTNLKIIARCESLISGMGQSEALRRCALYANAGADAILIHSKQKNSDEIISFCKEWKSILPVVIVPTTYPDLEINNSLLELGISTVIFANQALRASVRSMEEKLLGIRSTLSSTYYENEISSVKEIFKLQGIDQINNLEKKYA